MGVTNENPSLARKIAAGSLSGAVAAGVTNPLDLIKTRMQSKGNPDKTMLAATRSVLTQGGVKGLWRGSAPSMVSFLKPANCLYGLTTLALTENEPPCRISKGALLKLSSRIAGGHNSTTLV